MKDMLKLKSLCMLRDVFDETLQVNLVYDIEKYFQGLLISDISKPDCCTYRAK
jgi:hypothetical protein